MFSPSRDQVRSFLIDAWQKRQDHLPATPLETMAADLIEMHPEYHATLQSDDAKTREWTPEQGETNPFLHLSLHLAIAEQLSIDQPPGIRAAFENLLKRYEHHEALHVVLEALGEMMWRSQTNRQPPDADVYLDNLRRAATR
jgi:hypothetical protein